MPATYTQAARPLRITTPLGKDVLLLEKLVGEEGVSHPFRFRLDLLSEQTDVDATKLLGKPVGIAIDFGKDGQHTRHIGGIVARFVQLGRGPRLTRYRAEVVPKVWTTSLSSDSRIFQEKTTGDIAKELLSGIEYKAELTGQYEPWNFCVQYRESDQAFLSRILERDGIHFYHKHTEGAHELVLSDTSQQAPPCPAPGPKVKAMPGGSHPATSSEPLVYDLEHEEGVVSASFTLWDHNFQMPGKNLEATEPVSLTSIAGKTIPHGVPGSSVYDYPGGYAHHFDGVNAGGGDQAGKLQKVLDENKRVAKLRSREEGSRGSVLRGQSNFPCLTPGHFFTLQGHYRSDFNGDYFLVRVRHEAEIKNYEADERGPFSYKASFEAIPKSRPFLPVRATPPARVEGSHTATVVGPSGSEIYTDKYGRVKVQFHWDREGKKDAGSSCWVRVATPWAGKNWGMIAIPRVGSEVIVDFLEGDPDRPVITGMVYNPDFMPPYALPDNMTQSGIKSRSTQKGTAENFNEIRFEDKKDNEEIYVHAEKNLNTVVENNETRKVGFEKKDKGNQTLEVFNNQTVKIGAGAGKASDGSQTVEVYKDQKVTLKTGHQTVLLEQGNRTVTLNQGNETVQIKTGNRSVTLDTGNDALTIKTGNLTTRLQMGNASLELDLGNASTKAKLGKIAEEAMQAIEMKVGQSSIKIDQTGVTIKGMMVKVEGQIQTQIKGLMTQVNGDAMLMVKGGITMIN